MLKKLILIVFLFLLFFKLSTSSVSAQAGTFTCEWGAVADQPCSVNLDLSDPDCDYSSDSLAQEYCSGFGELDCANQNGYCADCDSPYVCRDSCSGEYIEDPDRRCTDPSQSCCLLDSTPPPDPEYCWNCELEGHDWDCYGPLTPNPDGTCDGFSTLSSCNANCPPESDDIRFNCIENTRECTPSNSGQYGTYNSCLIDCVNYDPPDDEFSCPLVNCVDCGDCERDICMENCPDCANCDIEPPPGSFTCPHTACNDCGDCYLELCQYHCPACGGCDIWGDPDNSLDRDARTPRCDPQTGLSDPDGTGILTAVGCVAVDNSTDFARAILLFSLGIGGGVTFILIVFSAFQITTSQGDPERLKAGKELLTSALAGLILIIFSVFILHAIGVTILQLPGF